MSQIVLTHCDSKIRRHSSLADRTDLVDWVPLHTVDSVWLRFFSILYHSFTVDSPIPHNCDGPLGSLEA